jgi:hypothetical protein
MIARIRAWFVRLGPPLLLVAGVTLFHWRGIRPDYTFLPVDLARDILPWRSGTGGVLQNWLISDPLYQYYPFLAEVVTSLRQGNLLLWNPAIFLGHPAGADPLFQVFYPVGAGFGLALGVERGFTVSLYVHVLLAALLTYGLLRAWGATRPAAVVGAFTYALSGYLITWLETPFWITTLAWLPGVVWAYQRALRTHRWRDVALAGLALGAAVLAGNLQFLVVFLVFLLFLAGAETLYRWRTTGGFVTWPLVSVFGVMVLGAAIGAVLLLPFAEFLPLTRRDVAQGLADPLPLSQLVTLLLPNFFGNPTQSSYWGFGNYSEFTLYTGVVALFLALLGVGARPRFWPTALAVFTAGVLYFALGGPGVTLLSELPFIRNASLHRALFILPLLVGWLAAIALSQPRLAWQPAALVAAGLAGGALLVSYGLWNPNLQSALALYQNDLQTLLWLLAGAWAVLWLRVRWPHTRRVGDWLLAGLVFANLFWYGNDFNPVGKIRNLMPGTATIDYLRAHAGLERVVGVQRNGETLFGANLLSLHGLREPGGYSSLVSSRLHALIAQDDPELDNAWMNRQTNMVLFSHPSERLLDMFSIRFLAAPEEIADPGPVAEQVIDGCVTQVGPLTTTQPLRGSFEVWRTAINRIDLHFAPDADAPQDGRVRFRLWRDGLDGTLIAENTLAAADIATTPQQTIYLAPEEHAPGRAYTWELVLEGPDAEQLFLCADATGAPALSIYGVSFSEVNQAEDVTLYRRLAPFYRASVVYAAEHIDNDAAAMTRVLDASFDLRNTVVTATPVDLPVSADIPATAAVVEHDAGDEVRIRATARQAGLLVLTDLHYPGWVATVDGAPTEILRVNHVMRGVPLSPGEHEIIFHYAPRSVQLGATVSVVGLMLAVGIIGLARLKRGRGEG